MSADKTTVAGSGACDVSVVIVSYNVCDFIVQCLRAVFASEGDIGVEVFVVDNASSDDTPARLRRLFPKERYPGLHIVANRRNVGFGRANNQVLSRAGGRYVLFLNPDTLIGERTLAESVAFADAHPDLGALGTMMLNTDGSFAPESRRGLPTPWTAFCKMTGLATLFPRSRRLGRYYMRYLDAAAPAAIDIVSGAYMLIPRRAAIELGGFDKDFFMYGEDIDLSYRLLLSGRQNYYIPSPILHYKGESTHKSTYRYVHVFYGAMLIFFKKHFRHTAWTLAVPVRLAIVCKALLELLWRQVHRFGRFLVPSRREGMGRQLYVGSHVDRIQALAKQCGLDVSVLPITGAKPSYARIAAAVPRGCIHVIFDAADFSHTEMLDYFRRSDHRRHIGVFTPEDGTLITGSYVLKYNPADEDL